MIDQAFLLDIFAKALYTVYILAFFLVPIELFRSFKRNWTAYVQAGFASEQTHTILEIRPPREVVKSPLTMEIFLTNLHQTGGEGSFKDKYWTGGLRPWFSLEITSIEGEVRFFITTRTGFKRIIESSLYSQYPDIEIFEVRDYAKDVEYVLEKNDVAGFEFFKAREDFFPIKTYAEFGLDGNPKEEFKIDPITPIIEFLSSIGTGEQVWIQILIRAHKKEMRKPGGGRNDLVDWTHFGKEYIKKAMQRDKAPADQGIDKLTKTEKAVLDAVENNIGKFAFDTGIRVLYVADSKHFNKGVVGGLKGMFRQFNSPNLNSFKADNDASSISNAWLDFSGNKLLEKKKRFLSLYKRRGYFPPLYGGKSFTMNTEELATLFHFPGQVVKSTTLKRTNAKKSEAPANLPI